MTPRIDRREYRDHLALLESERIRWNGRLEEGLRRHLLPEWTARERPGEELDLGLVMNRLVARLMTILTDHLNRIPEKHFAAFLDMVGVERLPGSPARVPLTFTPAAGTPVTRTVPAGTQVATTQTETDPAVFFETEESFDLTLAGLRHVVATDPARDLRRDLSAALLEEGGAPEPILALESGEAEHALYLAQGRLFTRTDPQRLAIRFTVHTGGTWSGPVVWEAHDGKQWVPLEVSPGSGWLGPGATTFELVGFTGTRPSVVGGAERPWIRVRAGAPLPAGATQPAITDIRVEPRDPGQVFTPEQAFFNTFPIDLERDFYPFGPRPRQNDAFYFCTSVLEDPDPASPRTVTITLALAPTPGLPPAGGTEPPPYPLAGASAELQWEYWSSNGGGRWKALPFSEAPTPANGAHFRNADDSDITLRFQVPGDLASKAVNGLEGYWIRARIASGHYGEDAKVDIEVDGSGTVTRYVYQPASFRAPFLAVARFEITYTAAGTSYALDGCKSSNHGFLAHHEPALAAAEPFRPFRGLADAALAGATPALYLGYDPAPGNVRVSQLLVLERPDAALLRAEAASDPPQLVWEYWSDAQAWRPLDPDDRTRVLSSSSTVAFTAPPDMAAGEHFGLTGAWIRARQAGGTLRAPRRLQGVHLNSVWASSVRTVGREVLGSGTGERGLTVRLARSPVLPGEVIRIREDNPLPAETLEALEALEREAAARLAGTAPATHAPVRLEADPGGGADAQWVRWYPVPNASFSRPDDRHYLIDRVSGEVTFHARPVPRGRDNVRVDHYRANQGENARRAAGIAKVSQLVTSLPYVDSVTNRLVAQGGAGPERELAQVLRRGPSTLKHRNRAVTVEDFRALALEAEPGLGLVRVLPVTNPAGERELGAVTLIVVPDDERAEPQPSPELLDQVRRYLARRGSETASRRIYVIGPEYQPVSVHARVIPTDPAEAAAIAARVTGRLTEYLHPLRGGRSGRGWSFEENVYLSDIYAVIEQVEGVDAVPHAELAGDDPLRVAVAPNRLVATGAHTVDIQPA